MRVLVTGGTGFLGSHLVEGLLEEPGTEVFALVRDPARPRWLEGERRVRFLRGDLGNIPALPEGLAAVYHAAGTTKTLRSNAYYTVNRDGTTNLLRALEARPGRPRFVHVSSLAAAGPSAPGRPVREDDPPLPVSRYGESKLQAEREVLARRDRFPVVILRPAAVYGPRDEDFLEFFRWIKRGVEPVVGPPRLMSLVHVRDVVRAALLAGRAEAAAGQVFHIADPTPRGWEDLGRVAASLLGKRPVRVRVPLWAAALAAAGSEGFGRLLGRDKGLLNRDKVRLAGAPGWVADAAKARRVLGFETRVALEEGLGETIAWYLAEGLL
ncbi:MAG TPA: NAD-dependent epimerase/dehydratase family protein [Candidatus Aminicenantes bacterium]|nr:NAD-dependent epimerase/dehydratase family protein [Candidatus Aminicenantes bacterium]